MITAKVMRGLGKERLSGVTGGQQPRDMVQWSTKVVAVAHFDRPRVEGETHPNLDRLRPVLQLEGSLRFWGCRHCIGRRSERGTKRIADRLEYSSAVTVD